MAFAFQIARSCRCTRSTMKTARLLTIFTSAVLLAGCASRTKQATTPTTPAQRTVPPPLSAQTSVPPPLFQTVTIIVTNSGRFIYIDGEVKRSDRFVWTPELTLTNAIALAGGFTDFANRRRLEIRRGDGSTEQYNYFRIRNGTTNDPALRPNDLVYVNRRWF